MVSKEDLLNSLLVSINTHRVEQVFFGELMGIESRYTLYDRGEEMNASCVVVEYFTGLILDRVGNDVAHPVF